MVGQPRQQPVLREDLPIDDDQRKRTAESGCEGRRHALIEQRDSLQHQVGSMAASAACVSDEVEEGRSSGTGCVEAIGITPVLGKGRLQGMCGIGCSLQNCREGYNLMNVVGSH